MLIKNQLDKEMNEINVTPFIDVMLVLLIIFMVVAPLITSSVQVELPKGVSAKIDEKKPIILFISIDELAINSEKIYFDELINKLNEKTNLNKEEIIYFHIDKNVNYEKIVTVMNELKKADYEKIALSTEIIEK